MGRGGWPFRQRERLLQRPWGRHWGAGPSLGGQREGCWRAGEGASTASSRLRKLALAVAQRTRGSGLRGVVRCSQAVLTPGGRSGPRGGGLLFGCLALAQTHQDPATDRNSPKPGAEGQETQQLVKREAHAPTERGPNADGPGEELGSWLQVRPRAAWTCSTAPGRASQRRPHSLPQPLPSPRAHPVLFSTVAGTLLARPQPRRGLERPTASKRTDRFLLGKVNEAVWGPAYFQG